MTHAKGFSTLEALCALMLLNLLGMGLLLWQWQALQAQQDAMAYQNAVELSHDLWQRMQLNASAASHYQLGLNDQAPVTDCQAQACSPAQWAQADLAAWQGELQLRIPGAKAQLETLATGKVQLALVWPSQLSDSSSNDSVRPCPTTYRCWQTTWSM